MIMEEKNVNIQLSQVIDYRTVFAEILKRKHLFYKTVPITAVVAALFILCFPRYYTTEVKLAPELESSSGSLSSIAASFGFDLGDMQTSDAISPLLYPDLMEDNAFVADMFNIKVVSQDGEISANYYDYLKSYQAYPWWNYPINFVKKLFQEKDKNSGGKFDPYHLSRRDNGLVEKIRDDIQFSVDKKTGIISINVTAQDALICKTLADSVTNRLQHFITSYRTNKARTDYEYYKGLVADAKQAYEKVRQMYGSLSDANSKVALRSVELKLEDMENDMQLKFNTYTTLNTQLEAAKAKVQERTPAFTIIKGAAVPVKPAGPKRMFFVLGMTILACIATGIYILKDIVSPKTQD